MKKKPSAFERMTYRGDLVVRKKQSPTDAKLRASASITQDLLMLVDHYVTIEEIQSWAIEGRQIQDVARELLLLRAECRAARRAIAKVIEDMDDEFHAYEVAKTATDAAGFSPDVGKGL